MKRFRLVHVLVLFIALAIAFSAARPWIAPLFPAHPTVTVTSNRDDAVLIIDGVRYRSGTAILPIEFVSGTLPKLADNGTYGGDFAGRLEQ